MSDIIPSKRRLEGQRGYIIHSRSWDAIVEYYLDLISKGWPSLPMLKLVEAIAASPAAAQLFGATSLSKLMLSDCADFRSQDSTLSVAYEPGEGTFHFHHRTFSGRDDQKKCGESEALEVFRLFLRLKFGVLLDIPPVDRSTSTNQPL